MKSIWLILVLILPTSMIGQVPKEYEHFVFQSNTPLELKKYISSKPALSSYSINKHLNPFYLRGDFDGDSVMDYALAVTTFGGPENDEGLSLAISDEGFAYITGFFEDKISFDLGTQVKEISAAGEQDIFIHALDLASLSPINSIAPSRHVNFLAYPNPTDRFMALELPPELWNGTITLYDASGRRVLQEHITQLKHRLDLASLLPGIYYLNIYTESDGVGYKKIILMK